MRTQPMETVATEVQPFITKQEFRTSAAIPSNWKKKKAVHLDIHMTIGKDPDAGKDWRQEEKGTTEDEMVGCHHWLNGHEFT